jgi:hypothetical protein
MAIDLRIGHSGMIECHSRAQVQGLRDAVQKTGLIDFLPMPRWKVVEDKRRNLRSKASVDDQFIGTR